MQTENLLTDGDAIMPDDDFMGLFPVHYARHILSKNPLALEKYILAKFNWMPPRGKDIIIEGMKKYRKTLSELPLDVKISNWYEYHTDGGGCIFRITSLGFSVFTNEVNPPKHLLDVFMPIIASEIERHAGFINSLRGLRYKCYTSSADELCFFEDTLSNILRMETKVQTVFSQKPDFDTIRSWIMGAAGYINNQYFGYSGYAKTAIVELSKFYLLQQFIKENDE